MAPIRVFRAMLAGLALTLGAAEAAELQGLTGAYGNEPGCRFEADGDYSDDRLLLLKKDEYQTYVTLCEFVQVLPARDGSQIVQSLCGHEGDEAQTIEFMRVVRDRDGRDAYEIFGDTGESRGRVEPCR